MKYIFVALIILSSIDPTFCQLNKENTSVQTGTTFNASSDKFNSTTAIGLFIEGNYWKSEKLRLGLRVEPVALAWGILVLPGGCDGECKEGANFLLNNYLKADYFIGRADLSKKGKRKQGYIGVQFIYLTHNRWFITDRTPGNYKDTRRWIGDPGAGLRLGYKFGLIDLSVSGNLTGNLFRNYVGINLAFHIFD